MKTIPVHPDAAAIVDDADFDRLIGYRWHLLRGYAVRFLGREDERRLGRRIFHMHREVLPCPDGKVVDHINRNRLDNRKCNLRTCTPAQNILNSEGRSSTGYKGVTRDRGRWKAHIEVAERHINLGRFESAEEAARARDSASLHYHREFAVLNFPGEGTDPGAKVSDPRRWNESIHKLVHCPFCFQEFQSAGIGTHRKACQRRAASAQE